MDSSCNYIGYIITICNSSIMDCNWVKPYKRKHPTGRWDAFNRRNNVLPVHNDYKTE